MSAYKDNNGKWRWRRLVTNPFTRERARLSGTPAVDLKSYAEAAERAAVEDFIMDPAKRPAPVTNRAMVRDVALAFLGHMAADPDLSPTYLVKLEGTIRNHIIPDLGDKALEAVTDDDLRTWLGVLRQKPRGLRGPALAAAKRAARRGVMVEPKAGQPRIKPRTVKDILRICHGMFVWAVANKMVTTIPVFPKPPKPLKAKPVFLEMAETHALYAAATSDDARLMIMFAVQSGLREGEQMALEWSDISFENAQITVRRTYKRDILRRWILGPPKGRSERIVDITPALAAALKSYRHLKSKLVFSKADGAHLLPDDFRAALRKARAAAGITRHFRWHDLRHTFGTHAAAAGADLKTIQTWMGHASISTTEMYAHAMPGRGKKQVELLTEIWT